MDRRQFLKALVALPATMVAVETLNSIRTTGFDFAPAFADDHLIDGPKPIIQETSKNIEPFWNLPRSLNVYRPATGETLNVIYWENGKLNMDGYTKLCWLMRDYHYKQAVWMDPRVFDLLRAIQAWVAAYGYTKPIQINSGYRTAAYNNKLEGAAKNSMHLHGKAIDIVVPGLPSGYISALAAHYQGGGVGFYPSSNFVHIDTGRKRYWVGK